MTILIFFLVLFVLVLVHEWGHFIVAKKTGMRVDEFGIGFPPKLFSIKKGETEYTFNLFPIGGFVRIWGEDGSNDPSSPVASEASDRRSEVSAEAGEGGEDVSLKQKVDYSRSFVTKSKWAQAAVLVAGVVMNVVLAWFLFFVIMVMGQPTAVDEASASPDARLTIVQVLPDSPAAAAEIPVGAVITDLRAGEDFDQILNYTSFSAFVSDHTEEDIALTYTLGEEESTVSVRAEAGVIADTPERKAIGVSFELIEDVKTPFYTAWYHAGVKTIDSLVLVTVGIFSFFADAFVGQADYSQVAGPVGIVGMVGDALDFGFTSLLILTAYLSLSLAVINMLPFPALDGGRLLFVAIEAVIRRPISPVWVMRLNAAGFLLLILLMVAVTYNDILRII